MPLCSAPYCASLDAVRAAQPSGRHKVVAVDLGNFFLTFLFGGIGKCQASFGCFGKVDRATGRAFTLPSFVEPHPLHWLLTRGSLVIERGHWQRDVVAFHRRVARASVSVAQT